MPQYTLARQAVSVTILTDDQNVLVLESAIPDGQDGNTLVRTPHGFFTYDKEKKLQPKDGAIGICNQELIQLTDKGGNPVGADWNGKENPSPEEIEARPLLSITRDRLEGIAIPSPIDYSLQLTGGSEEPIVTIPYRFQATPKETAAIAEWAEAMSNKAYRDKVKALTEGHSGGAVTGARLLNLEEFSGSANPAMSLLAPSADLQAWQECLQDGQSLNGISPVSGFPYPPSTPCSRERIAAGEFAGVGCLGLMLMTTESYPEVLLCRRANRGESYDSGGGYVELGRQKQEQPLEGLLREINEEVVGFFSPPPDNKLIPAGTSMEGAIARPVLYDLKPEQFHAIPVESPVDYRPMNQGNAPSCNFVYNVVLTPEQAERVQIWGAAMQNPGYSAAVQGETSEVAGAMIRPLSYLLGNMERDKGNSQWIANPVLYQACEIFSNRQEQQDTAPLSEGVTTEVQPHTQHPRAAEEIGLGTGATSRIAGERDNPQGPQPGGR